MPLPIPNLDDRTYADLLEEARALIPTYDPAWTNHNPTDPGITLIELFAWLSDMLIYRANRVPDQHLITFLKILNGQDWTPGANLAEDIRKSVANLRRPYRAVTCTDYETLAREASAEVARVKCIPRRNLGAGTEAGRMAPRPGHVSTIIMPQSVDPAPQPSPELRDLVWNYLDPRRILTTRHHVTGPVYAPVGADILIARQADAPAAKLKDQVVQALRGFLHPLTGGPQGEGWPFGRDIYVSELYQLLESIPGVDYVPDISLSSLCPEGAARCVSVPELWHDNGDFIGLDLAAHHLPWAQIDPGRIVISAAFLPIQIAVRVVLKESTTPEMARRAVKTALKRFFHPLYGGPDGTQSPTITRASLQALVQNLAEIETLVSLELRSDPRAIVEDELGQVTAVRIGLRELVDVQVTILLGE